MNKQKTYKLEIHHYLTPSAQFFFRRTMASTIYFFWEPEVTTSG